MKKEEIVITNRIMSQAAGRLRRIAKTRTDPAIKAAWTAAADKLAPKKGGAK
jgi:hypothetical protein